MSFLSKIFGTGVKEVIESASEIADKFITTPDEKKAFQLELEKLATDKQQAMVEAAQSEMDSILKDIQDARSTNTRIQETDKSSFLAKNMAYLIDIMVTLIWAGLALYIVASVFKLIAHQNQVDMTVVMALFAAVTSQFTTVITFHRGSSAGSVSKEKMLMKLNKEPQKL